MSKWEGGIISRSAKYRNASASGVSGVWGLNNHLRHVYAGNWPPIKTWPDDGGQWVDVTLTASTGNPDSTADYQVHHEDFDAANAVSGTGRLYIAVKVTAGTAYFNDFCIGAIQLTSDNYGTLEHGWSFNVTADRNDWTQADTTGLNTTNAGYENYSDIVGVVAQSWSAINTSASNAHWVQNSATGSSQTGAADGLADAYSDTSTGTIIGSGTTTIAQTSTTKFIYTEASGTQGNMINKWFWLRSPEVSLNGEANKNISIAYLACSPNNDDGMHDTDDTDELLRFWWVGS